MKIISKFISFFLIVVAVSACNTKEIDNPDNQNPDESLVSDIKLTANITQTRVNYSVNGGLLTQCWAEGDVIYGYYGSGTGSKVILTVEEVVDGIATLKPESGYEGFVAALKNQIKTQEDIILPFGLVYTGVDASDEGVLFTGNGKINVLLSKQDIGQIPACLQSVTYKIIPGKSEEKIVQFIFSNECAILEIESLTGIAEDAEITEGSFMELSSIKVSSSEDYNPLYNHIEFSYNGGLQSSSESSDYYNKFVAVSSTTERPLRVDDKGNIVDGQGNKSCIRIAVYPQGDVILKVTATPSNDEEHPFISEYKGTLSTGNCYIISSKDVVAKTEDGLYFTSVSAAFDHAAVLAETLGNDNTVTLVKDYINGLNEDVAHEVGNDPATIINIDYPVSLDLNGCTLSLDCDSDHKEWDSFYSGGFKVLSGGTLTIDDSKGSGYINSKSYDCPIITNSGTVNIVGGSLGYYGDSDEIIIPAVLTNTEADKDEDAFFNMSGGYIYGEKGAIVLDGNVKADISGGLIKSNIGNTVEVKNGLKGYFETAEGTKVPNCTISGGTIGRLESNNRSTGVSLNITDGSSCKISGGIIYNLCTNGNQTGAISCCSTDEEGDGTSLTVEWPKDGSGNDDTSLGEPLIYSCGKEPDVVPINVNIDGTTPNYALFSLMADTYIITILLNHVFFHVIILMVSTILLRLAKSIQIPIFVDTRGVAR